MKKRSITIAIVAMLTLAFISAWFYARTSAAPVGGGPFSSQPLALSWDDTQLAVVNPDANTVTLFSVQGDQNTKVSEIPTGKEPCRRRIFLGRHAPLRRESSGRHCLGDLSRIIARIRHAGARPPSRSAPSHTVWC